MGWENWKLGSIRWVKENKNPRILLDLPKKMDEMNVWKDKNVLEHIMIENV